jgi:hypothetical protein
LQAEQCFAVAEGDFDAGFPKIVTICNVMDDLADRPRVSAQGKVKVCFTEACQSGVQKRWSIRVLAENGLGIRLIEHLVFLSSIYYRLH